jgi:hypothetical protein
MEVDILLPDADRDERSVVIPLPLNWPVKFKDAVAGGVRSLLIRCWQAGRWE